MTVARIAVCLFLAALVACVGGGGGPGSLVTTEPTASLDELLNSYREGRGLNRLSPDPRLKEAATAHARDLAAHNRLGHRGSDGSDHIRRAERAGYGPYVGENVAAGQKSPAEVMQAWLGSRGHRANIELDPASHYGFAHAVARDTEYKHFWVLVVGRPPSDPSAPRRAAAGGLSSWWPF